MTDAVVTDAVVAGEPTDLTEVDTTDTTDTADTTDLTEVDTANTTDTTDTTDTADTAGPVETAHTAAVPALPLAAIAVRAPVAPLASLDAGPFVGSSTADVAATATARASRVAKAARAARSKAGNEAAATARPAGGAGAADPPGPIVGLRGLDDLPGHPERVETERRWFTRRRERTAVVTERRAPGPTGRRAGETASSGRAASADSTEPFWKRQYGRTVSADVVMAFSRQMSSFVEAGISVLEALEIVGEESGDAEMRKVVEQMHATLQRGGSFSEAVGAHPGVFPPYYVAMVRSAEFTGRLDEVLEQLAVYLDRDMMAKRQVRSALTYPTVVLFVTVIAMVVMSVFVLPKFADMYGSLGAELPLPTRMLLSSTGAITGNLPFIGAGLLALFAVAVAVIGGSHGKRRRDRLMMRLPVVGHLYHLISLERFCRVLAALAKSGVPLPDAIEMSAASTNNSVFIERMNAVRDTLIRGGGLAAPIAASELFPVAARQMIRVGEKTGTLAIQLAKAAAYYEREVAFHMKKATELFQPAVIMFVGGLVGFVAIAQVAAMYSVFGQVQGP